MLNDLRYAVRMLLKNPGFSFLAVVTLALGICGVTTQFSVIDAALIRGLPFPDADRLVRVAMRDPSWEPARDRTLWLPDVLEFREMQQSFTGLAGYYTAGSFILTIKDTPDRFPGSHVTPGFFSILGVKPVIGRDFVDSDHQPGVDRVTIISDSLWNGEFGGDPNVIGRQVRLNGRIATVIGVMPAGFQFPRDQLWMPMFNEFPAPKRPQLATTSVLGRLKPGVSLEQATAELELFLQRQSGAYPDTNRTFTVARVEPLLLGFVGRPARQLLMTMLGAVVAVLVIACANVMNMQFARATVRWRELAVRASLGASRARLIRQMLVECTVLAALGGALGALLAHWAVGLFGAVMGAIPGQALPSWMIFRIDNRVLFFTLGVTATSVLLSGLLPAVVASRTNLIDAMKEGARGHSGRLVRRLTGNMVVGQVALTCGLLICSLLLIKSINKQYALDFSYDLDSVLSGRMNLEVEFQTSDEQRSAARKILDGLRAGETLTHAAFTIRRNMMTNDSIRIDIEGQDYSRPEDRPQLWGEIISDGYFDALGLRPLEGREFEASDTGDRQYVVLVNQSFARKHFPGSRAIGRRIRVSPTDPWRTIVGVVPDTLMQGPLQKERDGSGIFFPLESFPSAYLTLVVRGREPANQLGPVLRRELAKVMPTLPIYNLGTPASFFSSALSQGRTVASLFTLFAAASVVLAAVGLYGVISFAVSRRTQEIGIRMSLGAQKRQIIGMVLREGGWQLAIGVVLGIGLTLALVRFGSAVVANFLYKVSPHDPAIYAAVVAVLAAAMSLACIVPARRAARVDPMVALRSE